MAEVLADFRTLQYYIAAAPAEPENAEDYYTEGWAALRQCAIDGHYILECAADTRVPVTHGGEQEQTKAELKQCVVSSPPQAPMMDEAYRLGTLIGRATGIASSSETSRLIARCPLPRQTGFCWTLFRDDTKPRKFTCGKALRNAGSSIETTFSRDSVRIGQPNHSSRPVTSSYAR